jgi:predicted metal-dependent HD superfamily phosphohydrolase
VPEADYRAGRTAILRRFLNRPAIYSTPLLFERYEQQARSNLQRAVAALQSVK